MRVKPLGFRLAFLLALVGIGIPLADRFLQQAVAGGRSDAEVKVNALVGKVDAAGKQQITVTLDINKGWHIYANPVGNADFEPAKTVVSLKTAAKPEEVKVIYPKGTVHQDKLIGEFAVYENRVQIQVNVRRAPGDTGPLELSVRFQACHDKGVCLPPATVKRTVK